jgi:hypothetical protein
MKAKREQQSPPFDSKRFRKELGLKIQRLVAESIEGWPNCENTRCHRAKRCASDRFECIAKWRSTLPPLTREEAQARLQDFRIALDARKRLGGDAVTAEQLAEAIRKETAARRAAMPPQEGDATPPVAEETQLAPEQQERINRIWNDYVAAKNSAESDARRGPRIRQL